MAYRKKMSGAYWLTVGLLALSMAALMLPTQAQTSRQMMNLQGRLTDTEGSPTTGPHLFELRIFDSGPAGSGAQLYYEAQRVEVNKGIYNILVGDGSSSFTGNDPDSYQVAGGKTGGIPTSVFNQDNLWLEIEIDEDNPLDPRTRIVSAAYAMNADTLDGSDSSVFVKQGADASFADVTASGVGAVDGSITNFDTDNISFTGGGELNSAKVTKLDELVGGGVTALHSHPSSVPGQGIPNPRSACENMGGVEVHNICVLKVENDNPKQWVDAVKDCASLFATLCGDPQTLLLRIAGVITREPVYTGTSHSDDDGDRYRAIYGNPPDDFYPTNAYYYACCKIKANRENNSSWYTHGCNYRQYGQTGVCVVLDGNWDYMNARYDFTMASSMCANLHADICDNLELRGASWQNWNYTDSYYEWDNSRSDTDGQSRRYTISSDDHDLFDGRQVRCCYRHGWSNASDCQAIGGTLWSGGQATGGVCVAGWESGNNRTAREWGWRCANSYFHSHVCSDADTTFLRQTGHGVSSYVSWTGGYADNDSGRWNVIHGGTGDDHDQDSGWRAVCCF